MACDGMNRTFRRMLCILAAVVTGCTLVVNGRAMDGRVIDKQTGKPIPGALVIVEWSGAVGGPVQSSRVCFHLEVVSTDADGRYHVPAWSRSPASDAEGGFFGIRNVEVTRRTYKAGYEQFMYDPRDQTTILMQRFAANADQRIVYLSRQGTPGCGRTDGSRVNEIALWKAICEETKSLPDGKQKYDFFKAIDTHFAYLIEDVNEQLANRSDEVSRSICR